MHEVWFGSLDCGRVVTKIAKLLALSLSLPDYTFYCELDACGEYCTLSRNSVKTRRNSIN